MSSDPLQTRRATFEDLSALRSFLRTTGVSDSSLEKRLTEFQLVTTRHGDLLACGGLHIDSHHGCLHHWLFRNPGVRESAEPLLWTRIGQIAQSRGLIRLWTRETGAFWKNRGFKDPTTAVLEAFPPAFGASKPPLLTLQLRDASASEAAIQLKIEQLQQTHRRQAETTRARVRLTRWILAAATLVGFGILLRIACNVLARFAAPLPKPRTGR